MAEKRYALIGTGANISMATGKPVEVQDLIHF